MLGDLDERERVGSIIDDVCSVAASATEPS